MLQVGRVPLKTSQLTDLHNTRNGKFDCSEVSLPGHCPIDP